VGSQYVNQILTANHFTEHDHTFFKSAGKSGFLRAENPEADVALLEIWTDQPLPIMTLLPEEPKPFEPLFLIGFTLGAGPFLKSGYSAGGAYLSTPCFYGDSGGPVFNSNNEVVGLIRAMLNHPGYAAQSASHMVLIKDIYPWLQVYLDE
jgi:hypothetical protein